nr:hypothetical protein Ade03nite_10480 [Actinoplanes derwentensis]
MGSRRRLPAPAEHQDPPTVTGEGDRLHGVLGSDSTARSWGVAAADRVVHSAQMARDVQVIRGTRVIRGGQMARNARMA